MKTTATISSKQVCALTGCTYRQLHYWVSTGVLRPHYALGGSGIPMEWDWQELLLAAVATELSRCASRVSHMTLQIRQLLITRPKLWEGTLYLDRHGLANINARSGIFIDLRALRAELELAVAKLAA